MTTEAQHGPAGRAAPRAFHLLAKPAGPICNLDCSYCFYLSKAELYPGSPFRMRDDLLEAYVRQLLEAHAGLPTVTIAWQGGEPTLMGLEFFRRAVELAGRYAAPGQRIEHTLQTNATRLDAEWAAFLREHGFLVGVSLDGPRELHDGYRVDRGGAGTFDRVLRGWQLLADAGVEVNVLCTVHRLNEERGAEVYRFFRDELGARFLQFIPIVERAPGPELVTDRSVRGEQNGRFLVEVFEEWVRRDVGVVFVQSFDSALASWVGEQPSVCIHSETCGLALALEHNGDVYSCDHFVEPRHRLGNIAERHLLDLVVSPQQQRFGDAKRDTLPAECVACDVRFACHGGCPKDRFATAPDGQAGLNYLCAGYRLFFRHVDRPMRFMADRLRRDGAPADIVRLYATEDAHRGRNDPCTCGSGRKWKRCHGGGSR